MKPDMEVLESRCTPSATVELNKQNLLTIVADNNGSNLTARIVHPELKVPSVEVVDNNTGEVLDSYLQSYVQHIDFQGGAGQDRFENLTGVPLTAHVQPGDVVIDPAPPPPVAPPTYMKLPGEIAKLPSGEIPKTP